MTKRLTGCGWDERMQKASCSKIEHGNLTQQAFKAEVAATRRCSFTHSTAHAFRLFTRRCFTKLLAERHAAIQSPRRCAGMISTRIHAMTDYLLPLSIAALAASGRFDGAVRRIMQVGPAWHLGYTLLTRYEGGLIPALDMRTHLACDAAGSVAFLGAGMLLRDQKPSHRLLLAAIGLGELVLISLTEDRPRRVAR